MSPASRGSQYRSAPCHGSVTRPIRERANPDTPDRTLQLGGDIPWPRVIVDCSESIQRHSRPWSLICSAHLRRLSAPDGACIRWAAERAKAPASIECSVRQESKTSRIRGSWSARSVLRRMGPTQERGITRRASRLRMVQVLLEELPEGISAPRCLAVEPWPDGTTRLWLEGLVDAHAGPWNSDQFSLAASRLGRFNGAYLAGAPLPNHPWLSRDWLRAFVAPSGPVLVELERLTGTGGPPLVRRLYPPPVVAESTPLGRARALPCPVGNHYPNLLSP